MHHCGSNTIFVINHSKNSYFLTVKVLYFVGIIFCCFPHEFISLEFNFADFAFVCIFAFCYQCTMHCQNVCVVFNFTETCTVHRQNSRNKFHAKFKAFTVLGLALSCLGTYL